MSTTRTAIVSNENVSLFTVRRYLPHNYDAHLTIHGITIEGEDSAGWTMQDYVLPRLASGGIYAVEQAEEA